LLVAVLALLGYGSRIGAGKPDPQVLYRWSTAAGGFIQDAVVILLVLLIAGFSRTLLAMRRPRSVAQAAKVVVGVLVAIYVLQGAYGALAHPGNEQGLIPKHWEAAHAAAFVANFVVICTWVPFVEELTFRGLGFALLERFGRRQTIFLVGLAFGLAHGLVLLLPVIVAFGCLLAWVRASTDSVFPGMVAHALFNAIALIAAVTIGS
jgi:membrane protease YdiL (CAAX protease family)